METFITQEIVGEVVNELPETILKVKPYKKTKSPSLFIIDTNSCSFVFKVVWETVEAVPGKELTPTQVKDQPRVYWNAKSDSFYTLLMTNPDAPSRADPGSGEVIHWLVVNIPGNQLDEGEVKAKYIGSGPLDASGNLKQLK